jgi:hypothetical protein
MHYVLNDQYFYFPSSNHKSYPLEEFLNKKCNNEHQLPIIVRILSSNIHERSIKTLLSKNIPLLLLNTHQFESILAEYHTSNDGRHHSNKHRLTLTREKLLAKKTSKYRSMKKLSQSLVTVTSATTNVTDDNSDDDDADDDDNHLNTRTIVRNLKGKRSVLAPLCRIPIHNHGYFELLNENDQGTEPCRKLSDLLIIEYTNDDNNQTIRTEKWPEAFFLRSTCTAYTKRYIPDERNLSGSSDSCYGSLSDLDSHKNLLILNDNKQILQPGQIIKILNQYSAYRSQISDEQFKTEQPRSHSSTSTTTKSWLRNTSRFFFPKKKNQSSDSYNNQSKRRAPTAHIYDIPKISQPYLKCQIERGDIVYISIYESGLFSPFYSKNYRLKSITDSENIDTSGIFRLKELLSNFRFPISVRLLNNSISFDNIYSPASINESQSSIISSKKFRLLLPYIEDVIFVCPLILPSSFKSQLIVIPIPLNSEITVQRCVNMREISKNPCYHNLLQTCYRIINRYQTEFSYIHFPLVLTTTTKRTLKRKQPLFQKRSQSESNIDYHSLDLTKDTYGKSLDVLNHDDGSDTDENLHHYDDLKTIKHNSDDKDQREKVERNSSYYAKIKIDKPRKYSRQQEHDSDDENYRELDHIYDYIRSGDITDDVQKIQEKEQALNAKYNQMNNISTVGGSILLDGPNSTIKVRKEIIFYL